MVLLVQAVEETIRKTGGKRHILNVGHGVVQVPSTFPLLHGSNVAASSITLRLMSLRPSLGPPNWFYYGCNPRHSTMSLIHDPSARQLMIRTFIQCEATTLRWLTCGAGHARGEREVLLPAGARIRHTRDRSQRTGTSGLNVDCLSPGTAWIAYALS